MIDYSLDQTNQLAIDIVVMGAPVTSEERAQLDDKFTEG